MHRLIRTASRRLMSFLLTEDDAATCVDLIYQHCLGRKADPTGLRYFTGVLQKGASISKIIESIEASPEARERRQGAEIVDGFSDGEFLLNVIGPLFDGRGAVPADIELRRGYLDGVRAKRNDLIQHFIAAYIARQSESREQLLDANICRIMDTERYLTLTSWQERAKQLNLPKSSTAAPQAPGTCEKFEHSGDYVVSAIASLYKGRRFLENFLENITSQTIFDRSEIIIVDANSPEGESEIIERYQKIYPNIIYHRINYRIGVYDAWNVGVQLARGRYLTTTNVDDLRRRDSLELQADALDRHPAADVIYQDFFYSFDPSLSFEDIARFGFKSELPIITPNNLLRINSPHNAPMWRKRLHDEVGLFDTAFKSAGDWEFWLRCLWQGKGFFKINTPHIAYFQNPEGVSTRPDTRGLEEGREVLKRYSRRLIAPALLTSRQKFAELIGTKPDWQSNLSYYDVAQAQLKRLGDRHKNGLGVH
jgi:glycosyltransferase involved in cell wall biosynthesis